MGEFLAQAWPLLAFAALILLFAPLADKFERSQGMDALTPEEEAEVSRRVERGIAPLDELGEAVESLRESMGVPYIGPERRSWRAQRLEDAA